MELKTPKSLRQVADDSAKELLEELLSRTGVKYQLNTLAAKLYGEGLRDHDETLAKRLRGLFDQRNFVAHRGETPDANDARDGISAAEEVFAWLDSLEPGDGA